MQRQGRADAYSRKGGWLLAGVAMLAAGCSGSGAFDRGDHRCEEVARVVADDEMLPSGHTVQDLLDAAEPATLPATWTDQSTTEVTVTLGRAKGDAEWIDAKQVEVPRFGVARSGDRREPTTLPGGGTCEGYVRFPARLELQTADGLLGIAIEGTARNPPDGYYSIGELSISMAGEQPFVEVEGLPPLEEVLTDEQLPPSTPVSLELWAHWPDAYPPWGEVILDGESDPIEPPDGGVLAEWMATLLWWDATEGGTHEF